MIKVDIFHIPRVLEYAVGHNSRTRASVAGMGRVGFVGFGVVLCEAEVCLHQDGVQALGGFGRLWKATELP